MKTTADQRITDYNQKFEWAANFCKNNPIEKFIALSLVAQTLPDTMSFSEWVSKIESLIA